HYHKADGIGSKTIFPIRSRSDACQSGFAIYLEPNGHQLHHFFLAVFSCCFTDSFLTLAESCFFATAFIFREPVSFPLPDFTSADIPLLPVSAADISDLLRSFFFTTLLFVDLPGVVLFESCLFDLTLP